MYIKYLDIKYIHMFIYPPFFIKLLLDTRKVKIIIKKYKK